MVKWVFCSISLAICAWLIPGITISSGWALLTAALVIGILNAFVRPLLIILTLPLTILTLGIFIFIINASMIILTSAMVGGFHVNGFGTAFLAALLMTVVSFILHTILPGIR